MPAPLEPILKVKHGKQSGDRNQHRRGQPRRAEQSANAARQGDDQKIAKPGKGSGDSFGVSGILMGGLALPADQ